MLDHDRAKGSNALEHAPAATIPLVREFTSLTEIATRASDHEVLRAVGTAARERDYMVNMIVHDLLATPVATALLALQLSANVRWGVSTVSGCQARTAADTLLVHLVRVGGAILAVLCQYRGTVLNVVLSLLSDYRFVVICAVLAIIFSHTVAVFCAVLEAIRQCSIAV